MSKVKGEKIQSKGKFASHHNRRKVEEEERSGNKEEEGWEEKEWQGEGINE